MIDPIAIESKIAELSDVLEQGSEDYRRLLVDAAGKSTRYRVARAKAWLRITEAKNIPQRDAMADVATEHEHTEAELAEALSKSQAEANRNTRERLGALRTLSASLRGQT